MIPEGKLLALQLLPFKVPEICRKKIEEEEIYISKNNKNRTKLQEMYILLEYLHIYNVINNATVEMWVIANCL